MCDLLRSSLRRLLPRLSARNACTALLLLAASACITSASAQTGRTYTAADYAHAERLMNYKVDPLVYHTVKDPEWLPDGRLWYRDLGPDGLAYMLVDPARRTEAPAFDASKVGAALQAAQQAGHLGLNPQTQIDPAHLVIDDLALEDHDHLLLLTIDDKLIRCSLGGKVECSGAGDALPDTFDVSPDGRSGAFIHDNNLWVRDLASGRETQLTQDGEPDFGYATDNAGWTHTDRPILMWSPDSKKIATYQQDQRKDGWMYLVSTEVGHPQLEAWRYPLPGDENITMIQRVVIDVPSRKVVRLKMPPDQHRSSLCDDVSCAGGHGWDDVQWSSDSRHLAFVSTSRDHKQETLRVADADTGDVRDVLTETVPTYFESGDGKVNWRYLPGSNEVLWYSQRDNWGQLYLYDLATGKLKNQITHGDGDVTQVLSVDEKARRIYFIAVGKESGWDPYFPALYRIDFDGSGIKLLTPQTANHDVSMSPDGRSFLDIASTPTTPQTTTLRDDDGAVLLPVARQDISRLHSIGWQPLMPITVKARDGRTDLYGYLFRPTDFDPAKHYPVVDWVYPGPQTGSCGDRSFSAAHGDLGSLADLGFVVVCIDGLGTPKRSKAFHDALYGDMGDNTIPDQVAGIRQLAARYPWIDATRVGIYGHSGGGAAAAAAMFHFPDFFKVGISESGNHDNRVYEDDWAEKWIGLLRHNPDGTTNYDSQANENYASQLKGHLLLMYGTMDTNVPPNNTLLVVDALIKANKDFDILPLPNIGHPYDEDSPYVMRRRWDYFVHWLAGGTPPHEYRMTPWEQQKAALARAGRP
ncbi:MAG TPA: DPP IV N-terminal domain-containing protein [Acidobacteriaceae bacterium]|nr:DPP IV N-terminal domain-containing protein [Acidobacteriaceae bacterium]